MTTDTTRRCPGCGVPEQRTTDGRTEQVNLCPLTGLCVDCLIAYTHECDETARDQARRARAELPFDARAAAARNDV